MRTIDLSALPANRWGGVISSECREVLAEVKVTLLLSDYTRLVKRGKKKWKKGKVPDQSPSIVFLSGPCLACGKLVSPQAMGAITFCSEECFASWGVEQNEIVLQKAVGFGLTASNPLPLAEAATSQTVESSQPTEVKSGPDYCPICGNWDPFWNEGEEQSVCLAHVDEWERIKAQPTAVEEIFQGELGRSPTPEELEEIEQVATVLESAQEDKPIPPPVAPEEGAIAEAHIMQMVKDLPTVGKIPLNVDEAIVAIQMLANGDGAKDLIKRFKVNPTLVITIQRELKSYAAGLNRLPRPGAREVYLMACRKKIVDCGVKA